MPDAHVAILRAEDDFDAGTLETVSATEAWGQSALAAGVGGITVRRGQPAGEPGCLALQSLLFDIAQWDAAAAKSWLHARGLEFLSFRAAVVVLGGQTLTGKPWPSSQAARDAQGT